MKKNKSVVWDPLQRVLHWSLAALMLPAGFSGGTTGPLHERLGYATLALVAVRLAWGFYGSRYARFEQFVRGPHTTLAYLRAAMNGCAPRHLGHNPLGGWMILALLTSIIALALTGWLFTTDWLWGYGWLMDLHNAFTALLAALVVLHVAGVVYTGRRHRENLVAAMFSGNKRPPQSGDVS